VRIKKLLITAIARKILFLIVPFHGNGDAAAFGVQILPLGSGTTSQYVRSNG